MFDSDALLSRLKQLDSIDQVVVAYSGGLDSSVLLDALVRLRDAQQISALRAVHVNHGISARAQDWQSHCETVCELLRVPLQVEKVDVERGARGLEDAAREARYVAFLRHLNPVDNLVTAQHLDDQAETVLLRLLRGAGPRGLGAMRDVRALGPARLVRPLLHWRRDELLDYAKRRGLEWTEDDSNQDIDLDRNYLRHQVMPSLASRWPGYASSLGRAASLAQDADQALAGYARAELAKLGAERGTLSVAWLRNQAGSMQGGLLQEWARMLGLPLPGAKAIERILSEVMNAAIDGMPKVEWGPPGAPVEMRRYRDQLYLMAAPPPHDASLKLTWAVEPCLVLPDGSRLMAQRSVGVGIAARHLLPGGLEIRFRQGGERCQPVGRSGSHPLKKVFQELEIPPWVRDRIPLIYNENELISVAGCFTCEGYAAGPDEEGCEVSWEARSIEPG